MKATIMHTNHETILDVAGMRCSSCARRISSALGVLPGVTSVDVRLHSGAVVVRHDPAQTSVEALVAALAQAGYGARLGAAA